jgi:hypothetical protein
VRTLESWITPVVTELARVVRHALGSWGRTTRLCVLTVVFAMVVGALMELGLR